MNISFLALPLKRQGLGLKTDSEFLLRIMSVRFRGLLLLVLMALAGTAPTFAQNNRFTERSFVASPSVRAMGDAGVALPGEDRPFFYNPALLPHISSYFTVLGVQAAASRDLNDQIDFFNQRIRPAVESGFRLETDALERLYRDAYQLGRHPIRGNGAVVLPSFVYSTNGFGIGGGIFAKTALNYRMNDAGVGVPEVYLLSRTDVMALVSLGMDLGSIGLDGASVGVTATRTRRFLAFENKPLDTFTADETAILLQGNTFQVDVGGLYSPDWGFLPGTLRIGGAMYDVLDQRYEYVFSGSPRIPFLEGLVAGSSAVDAGAAEQDAGRARRQFRLRPSYRVGVSYRLNSWFFFDDVGVAADYQGYGHDQQSPLARLHLGGRAEIDDVLILRGGLSAGYPTGGLGVQLGSLQLDYAYHGFEDGRVPGQINTYVHTARVMLRIR